MSELDRMRKSGMSGFLASQWVELLRKTRAAMSWKRKAEGQHGIVAERTGFVALQISFSLTTCYP